MMKLDEFDKLLSSEEKPVVLLEGRRKISDDHAAKARRLGEFLASRHPAAIFRSGNATGSDAAFAEGVASVDPARLEIVMPYQGHRKSVRYSTAVYDSPESLAPEFESGVVRETIQATPANRALIEKRGQPGRLGAKGDYLVRDTMKVLGNGSTLRRPVVGLFYVDPKHPDDGGTGHTIRVCRRAGVPVAFQISWMAWIR